MFKFFLKQLRPNYWRRLYMKIVILILISFIFVISCKKIKLPDNQSELLIGKWKFVSSSGGMTGKQENTNQSEIEFTKYGKFKFKDKKLFTFNKNFEFKYVTSIYNHKEVTAIKYSDNFIQSFLIRNDTLFLNDEVYDGYCYTYIRK